MHIRLTPGLNHLFAAFALLAAAPLQSAEPVKDAIPIIPEATEKKILGHMQETSLQRLQGWPGMIFYCDSAETDIAALKQICAETYARMEALASQHNVKFHKARNANDVALLPHLTGRLKLVVELTPTEAPAHPAAIAARVAVLAHYSGAINRYAELGQDESQSKHPLNIPQHVDGILWEGTIVKAATNLDELIKPVAEGLDRLLQDFFATYAKANKPKDR